MQNIIYVSPFKPNTNNNQNTSSNVEISTHTIIVQRKNPEIPVKNSAKITKDVFTQDNTNKSKLTYSNNLRITSKTGEKIGENIFNNVKDKFSSNQESGYNAYKNGFKISNSLKQGNEDLHNNLGGLY